MSVCTRLWYVNNREGELSPLSKFILQTEVYARRYRTVQSHDLLAPYLITLTLLTYLFFNNIANK